VFPWSLSLCRQLVGHVALCGVGAVAGEQPHDLPLHLLVFNTCRCLGVARPGCKGAGWLFKSLNAQYLTS
jgi:hypothetical protein